MSTTRNVLGAQAGRIDGFTKSFSFYLDSLDRIYQLEGDIGLEGPALAALTAEEQPRFKAYLFIMESVNTTSLGSLCLLASNLHSDSFSLLRMIYEAAALMWFGNQSAASADELARTLLTSGLADDVAQSKMEWALIKKAENQMEGAEQGFVPMRQKLNNFGAHLSRAKISLGNVTVIEGRSASSVFVDNSHKAEYLMALDLLHGLHLMVLEQYDKHACAYPGACESVAAEIAKLKRRFLAEVRPRLQAMERSSGE